LKTNNIVPTILLLATPAPLSLTKVKVTLRLTVSLGVNLLLFDSYGLVLWSALSDERTGLSFVYAAGPCQRSLSQVRVQWDLRV
jgi:hypothetical protein